METLYCYHVLEIISESYPRVSYFKRRLKCIAPRMKRIVGIRYLLISTILLLPSMTSALLDPCPDGYYYMRMTEECLPCEKLCNHGYDIQCERRCQGFTTTTTMTSSPITTLTTESPTTEANKADIMVVMYILIGLLVGLLTLIGCIDYIKCKPKKRQLQRCLLCTQNEPAHDAVITVQATQEENESNTLDPTEPGVSQRLLVPETNLT